MNGYVGGSRCYSKEPRHDIPGSIMVASEGAWQLPPITALTTGQISKPPTNQRACDGAGDSVCHHAAQLPRGQAVAASVSCVWGVVARASRQEQQQ